MPAFAHCFAHHLAHRQRTLSSVILAAALTTAGATACAQTIGTNASAWALGGGVAAVDTGYRDIDRDVLALPLISYENKWISATVPTLDVKLHTSETLSLRARVRYARDGYEAGDSPYLAGMRDRDGGFWLGGAMLWRSTFAQISGEVLHDASGKSKSARARVQAERRFGFGAFGISPRVGVEWVDRKFVDYYYGVRAAEVRPGRAAYQGDASASAEAGLRIDYQVAPRQTVFLDLRASRFGSGIKDSPLVEQSGQTGLSLGYLYRF